MRSGRTTGVAVGAALALGVLFPSFAAGTAVPEHGLTDREAVVHALNRLGYGPRPGDVDRVLAIGLNDWIERQLHPEKIADPDVDRRLVPLQTIHMDPTSLMLAEPPPGLLRAVERMARNQLGVSEELLHARFPEMDRGQDGKADGLYGPRRIGVELGQAKLIRAVYSERQIQEVMTDFWFNHFNVYLAKGTTAYWIGDYEREAIRPHALGRFRDLLEATARHPAMLLYLDNWRSSDPDGPANPQGVAWRVAAVSPPLGSPYGGLATTLLRDRGFDTSLMEERFRRLAEASYRGGGRFADRRNPGAAPDGSKPGLNENYARELLELHTVGVDGGYTQEDIEAVARCFTGWTLLPVWAGQGFAYVDSIHVDGRQAVLGRKIRGKGMDQGLAVLDLVAQHPSTARFVSTKLARRFVGDDPPEQLVDRMATTFLKTDGDIREVLRTLFSSPEFWSDDWLRGKVKTPLEFVASAARATGAEIAALPGTERRSRPGLLAGLRDLGQPPYMSEPPTGYGDVAGDWISTGALLNRAKLALGLAADRVPGTRVERPVLDESGWDPVGELGERILGTPPDLATVAAIRAALGESGDRLASLGLSPSMARTRDGQARLARGWLLASPEFQRR